jgi:hypothetical protein
MAAAMWRHFTNHFVVDIFRDQRCESVAALQFRGERATLVTVLSREVAGS